jgi:hypothetical protein
MKAATPGGAAFYVARELFASLETDCQGTANRGTTVSKHANASVVGFT